MALLEAGYWPTTYYPSSYWDFNYWLHGWSPFVPPDLLSPGYWHTTYWSRGYYNPDYWLHYGTADVGGVRGTRMYVAPRKSQREFSVGLAVLVKEYLEAKLGENT